MDNLNIIIQEAWENQGNTTQFDERIIKEIREKSGYFELLEACKKAYKWLEAGSKFGKPLGMPETLNKLQQAIAKAEGGSNA